jgi:AdoMet-dependent rRNA methyltransferase SPB1
MRFPTDRIFFLTDYDQLGRLHAQAAARTKRERRRANEVKTRTIQRMQLQMTTPLDIGLEQQDASLALGQDDVFDLMRAENALRNGQIKDDDDAMDESGDDEMEDESESDAVLDSDQEREKKVVGLEAELDGLYDAYQDRLRERDAKYKVMEARRKNAEREEWGGIQDDQNDDDDSSVGGWDEKAGSDLSSDSESDDEPEAPVVGRKKRPHVEDPTSHSSKRPRLVTKLEEPKLPVSKAAQVWFSQDVFAGMNNGEEEGFEDDSEDENMSIDEHSHQTTPEAAVRTMHFGCF